MIFKTVVMATQRLMHVDRICCRTSGRLKTGDKRWEEKRCARVCEGDGGGGGSHVLHECSMGLLRLIDRSSRSGMNSYEGIVCRGEKERGSG